MVWSLLLYGPITGEEGREERRGGGEKERMGLEWVEVEI